MLVYFMTFLLDFMDRNPDLLKEQPVHRVNAFMDKTKHIANLVENILNNSTANEVIRYLSPRLCLEQ